jgi:hypothetical protein
MALEDESAETLIKTLYAHGWNNSEIGRAVGRNASMIRQGAVPNAKGYLKPLTPLLPALRTLVATGKGPSVGLTLGQLETGHRATKAGTPAAVRQRAQRLGAAAAPEQQALHVTTNGNKTILKTLDRAAKEGKQVMLTPTFTNVRRSKSSGGKKRGRGRAPTGKGKHEKRAEVPLFQKGGWDAQKLLDRINNPRTSDPWKAGDARGAMKGLAKEIGIVESVGALQRVEIHAFNPT